MKVNLTADKLQDLLVAIAPIVGSASVMSAAGHIAIAVAEATPNKA